MSSTHEHPLRAELRQELTEIRGKWLWFVLLGAALVIMGVVALGETVRLLDALVQTKILTAQ